MFVVISRRMQTEGFRIRIHLVMGAENLNMTKSRNTVAEITGSTYPEQVLYMYMVCAPSACMRSEGYCSWVCLSVCVSVIQHLTYRPTNVTTYLMKVRTIVLGWG